MTTPLFTNDVLPSITQDLYNSKDALHMGTYAITKLNDRWTITYLAVPSSEARYLDCYDTQQEAVTRVLIELGHELDSTHDISRIDNPQQPEPVTL